MQFHIIVAMYNVAPWIEENISIIRRQTYSNFTCTLIDDLSTDNSVILAKRSIDHDPRFKVIVNTKKKYKTYNVVAGIAAARPDNEDVIVIIDSDDRLMHENVLQIVYDTYQKQNCWMTYGSYCNQHGECDRICRPYDQRIIDRHQFREAKWLASHLKTFKYKLWQSLDMDVFSISEREIKQARRRALLQARWRTWWHWRGIQAMDLMDSSGRYIRRVDDKAFTYPMLEICGHKAVFIKDLLYQYGLPGTATNSTVSNYGQDKCEKWHTRLIRDIVVHKPPYERLATGNALKPANLLFATDNTL
jgi:glycosyltransferase involved in cell wall biosynthesis